ncbi:hypothetical protein [Halobaculum roseum]|uniref:Uncharacterized protein n=1 Tax=Halobaculum roseum TaxID=2175149 RepID=A0ABD5MP07_9EURY|nr:hypothetical protein [Halobaculum roseum]
MASGCDGRPLDDDPSTGHPLAGDGRSSTDCERSDRRTVLPDRTAVVRVSVCLVLLVVAASGTVAAQDEEPTNPVCTDESDTLANMIEGFVQITTGLGIMGLLVVWQADALMEMFTLGREQKAKIKQHKRGAGRSALTLVVLGPLFTVGGTAMDLPIAECVDLIPF